MSARNAMQRASNRLCSLLVVGAAATMLANATNAQQASPGKIVPSTVPAPTPAAAAQKSHEENEGERVFAANCSRCHTAPDGFPQRISGTIVRHMRVRASLSEREEQALLRFFYPQ